MGSRERKGKLRDCEVFFLTDNMVAENDFYNGSLLSETLFNLTMRLRKLELEGGNILYMIHVSGTRMIASGLNTLLRGDTTKKFIQENK